MTVELEPRLFAPDIAIVRIKQFLDKHQVDEAQLKRVRALVELGIDLKANLGKIALDYKTTTLVAINDALATSIYYAACYLNRPFPDRVGFVEAEDGVPSVNANEFVLARSRSTKEFPNGEILYSVLVLTAVANRIEGNIVSDLCPDFLSPLNLSPHEMFHLFQEEHFSEQLARDDAIYRSEGLKGWSQTFSEREAAQFGDCFVKARELHLRGKAQYLTSDLIV